MPGVVAKVGISHDVYLAPIPVKAHFALAVDFPVGIGIVVVITQQNTHPLIGAKPIGARLRHPDPAFNGVAGFPDIQRVGELYIAVIAVK